MVDLCSALLVSPADVDVRSAQHVAGAWLARLTYWCVRKFVCSLSAKPTLGELAGALDPVVTWANLPQGLCMRGCKMGLIRGQTFAFFRATPMALTLRGSVCGWSIIL